MGQEHLPGDLELIRKHAMYPKMQNVVHPRWRTDDYASYLLQATRFAPKRYDYVLIDGMARGQAAFMVLDMIDERSRVAIHDFWVVGKTGVNSHWNLCELLKYYRVEAAISSERPYVSGGSVVVLQKLGKRHSNGPGEGAGTFDSIVRNGAGCGPLYGVAVLGPDPLGLGTAGRP